jgi:membrane protein DedA with SNARE-associated domain
MSLFASITALIAKYGLFGIASSMVVENIGIPFPTEGAFLVGQQLISKGTYSFWMMYWFLTLTQVLGAVIAYWIGKGLGHLLLAKAKPDSKLVKSEKKVTEWYEKYGSTTVFATRVIGYVRPWSSIVAGMAQFPFWQFLLWTLLGTMVFVYPTMQATGLLVRIWSNYPGLHIVISLGMLALFLGGVLYGVGRRAVHKRRAARALEMTTSSVPESKD